MYIVYECRKEIAQITLPDIRMLNLTHFSYVFDPRRYKQAFCILKEKVYR